jgi:serine/threonine-protein kinase
MKDDRAAGPELGAEARVPRQGERIAGKYRVESVLGEGGMGVVLAARHEALGQEVAIKFLRPDAVQIDDAGARFLREARTAAALRSEHVVRVVDVGVDEAGLPYMVMERLVGADLAASLSARGPIPAHEAVEYVLQACEAMAEAHALGVVHRDLKPANLFLTRRPNGAPLVKILDFGISKVDESGVDGAGAGQLTRTGAIMGSPLYMSPEQVRNSRKVDARSDIWSLGVILHELVAGRHPFEGETTSGIVARIAADPPIPLRQHRPDAPPELEAVVLRCLEKDLARRLPDVATLIAALRSIANAPAPPGGGDPASFTATVPHPAAVSRRGSEPFAATQELSGGSTQRRRRRTALAAIAVAAISGAAVLLAKSGMVGAPAVKPVAPASLDVPAPAVPAPTGAASAPPSALAEATAPIVAPASAAVAAASGRSKRPVPRETRPPAEARSARAAQNAPPQASSAGPAPRDPLADR